jgi:hypothetical protein
MNEITKELLEALQDCERVMSEELKGLLVIQPELKNARAAIAKAEAALSAPQSDDGWIPWEGGACPVEVGTRVDVRYRDGWEGGGLASKWRWHHETRGNPILEGGDIIAYRAVKP